MLTGKSYDLLQTDPFKGKIWDIYAVLQIKATEY